MPDFKGVRIEQSHQQFLKGSTEQIFPLLCPTREYDWIKEWTCELIYSDSGFAEPNCVFRTEYPITSVSGATEEIWFVSRYEPPTRIEFSKFSPGLYVLKYEIDLVPSDDGTVTATWTQYVTGLSEIGNRYLAARRQEDYNAVVKALEVKLNYYLLHGECMP